MRPGRCENPSKIMKNVTRGVSGGVSGASLFQERKKELRLLLFNMIYVKKVRFWMPFRGHWILKGVPQSNFNLSARHLYKESFVAKHLFEKQKTKGNIEKQHHCIISNLIANATQHANTNNSSSEQVKALAINICV